MTDLDITFTPTLTFLSDGQKEKIYQAALTVLDNTGMTLLHEEGLSLLKDAGCRVEGDNLVKIPPELVENALQTAPKNIPIYNRQGEPAMDLGGRRAYYGTGSDLIYAIESDTMKRHQTTLEDIQTAARVSDAL